MNVTSQSAEVIRSGLETIVLTEAKACGGVVCGFLAMAYAFNHLLKQLFRFTIIGFALAWAVALFALMWLSQFFPLKINKVKRREWLL